MTGPARMRYRSTWWFAACKAALILPAVKVLLGLAGYRRTAVLLRHTSQTGTSANAHGEQIPPDVEVLASAVALISGRRLFRSRCLARSLTLWWLARHDGYELQIVIGVAPPVAGVLAAHAWVEYGGTPVNDTPDVRQRYSALPSRPERAD